VTQTDGRTDSTISITMLTRTDVWQKPQLKRISVFCIPLVLSHCMTDMFCAYL